MSVIREPGWLLAIALICATCSLVSSISSLEIVTKWKYIDYDWESEEQKANAVNRGLYNESRVTARDLQPLPDDRILLTLPKLPWNNPSSLAIVTNINTDAGPLVRPYPNWAWHTAEDCSGITNVHRITLDDCGKIWAVDSGTVGGKYICPAKIFVIDTNTDEVVDVIPIPDDVARGGELLTKSVVTSGTNCDKHVKLYISDITGNAVLVSDGTKTWRKEHESFEGFEEYYNMSTVSAPINLEGSSAMESLVVVRGESMNERWLLFKPLASYKINFMRGDQLDDPESDLTVYQIRNYTLPSPRTTGTVTFEGIAFCASSTTQDFACLSTWDDPTAENTHIFTPNPEDFVYTSAIKPRSVEQGAAGSEELWFLTIHYPYYLEERLDISQYTVKIIKTNLAQLVEGTVCDPKNNSRRGSNLPANATKSERLEEDITNLYLEIVD